MGNASLQSIGAIGRLKHISPFGQSREVIMSSITVQVCRRRNSHRTIAKNATVLGARLLGVAAIACGLICGSAMAAPIFYSTGTHVTNGLDMDWLVSTGYGSFNSNNFVQAHTWVHGNEMWITDAQVQQYQYFTFRQYFDLTGYNASNVDLKFYWGCDDLPQAGVTMPLFSINGGMFQGSGLCSGYEIGTKLIDLTSGFLSGQNYIDFRVQGNYATNGMGLKVVSFSAGPGNPIPEPSSLVIIGVGLAGLFASRHAKLPKKS